MEDYIRGLTWAKSLYQTFHSGGCKVLSLGRGCSCFLCQIDREIAKAKDVKIVKEEEI